jgi:hypothetical protein
MTTVSMSAGWLINDKWTARASVGAILDGTLETRTRTVHTVEPGGLVAIGAEYLAHEGDGATPFVDLSFFLGSSLTRTKDPDSGDKTGYFAVDARLGARAVWALNQAVFPFIAARVFGGPVNWEWDDQDVVGTDVHHYQLAIGSAVQVGSLGLWVEWAGLGEQALGAGLSTTW